MLTVISSDRTGLVSILSPTSQIDKLKEPSPVHRLDARVCGVLVVAKTHSAASHLGSQFAERRVHKCYCAIVQGKMARPEGESDGGADMQDHLDMNADDSVHADLLHFQPFCSDSTESSPACTTPTPPALVPLVPLVLLVLLVLALLGSSQR